MPGIDSLTSSAIERIAIGEDLDKPILQVLGLKDMGGERWRLLISDGRHFTSFALLSNRSNHLLPDLAKFTIIQVDKFITLVWNKFDPEERVLIISDFSVVNKGAEVGRKIGEPSLLPEMGVTSHARAG